MSTMIPGFLPGSRASLMMDVVATAMVVVVPLLTYSLILARRHRRFAAHRRIQLGTGAALFVTVFFFEIDVRLNGWVDLARPSPYFATWLFPLLYLHLVFAISTTVLWATTITHALRHFASPPHPGPASRWHRRLGRSAALGTYCTAVTGWTFYWAAFLA